uniref:Ig-like domain-containing protein n=1 Tax=Neogobius melanostomus TaxID=47308 RepID=A0A8C6S540_9GOBI
DIKQDRYYKHSYIKTLVCVASGFYPDHVEVSWKVNEEPRKKRVSTDLIAQRSGTTYTISSRLVVDEDEWTDPNNCFNCIVNFYNGKTMQIILEKSVALKVSKAQDKYLKITQNAKLSYVVFIVKGAVYGLFVAFLVWKIQVGIKLHCTRLNNV